MSTTREALPGLLLSTRPLPASTSRTRTPSGSRYSCDTILTPWTSNGRGRSSVLLATSNILASEKKRLPSFTLPTYSSQRCFPVDRQGPTYIRICYCVHLPAG